MSALNGNGIAGQIKSNKKWAWAAAGLIVLGLSGLANLGNEGPEVPLAPMRGGYGPQPPMMAPGVPQAGYPGPQGGFVPQGGSYGPQGGAVPQMAYPQAGGYGYTPGATAAPGGTGPGNDWVPGDSVSNRVYEGYSDVMRGQQRVTGEYDGQTWIVPSEADPNQMYDAQAGVGGYSGAGIGAEASGYATVDPSGATTPNTWSAAPATEAWSAAPSTSTWSAAPSTDTSSSGSE
jgi:hypothetical protein